MDHDPLRRSLCFGIGALVTLAAISPAEAAAPPKRLTVADKAKKIAPFVRDGPGNKRVFHDGGMRYSAFTTDGKDVSLWIRKSGRSDDEYLITLSDRDLDGLCDLGIANRDASPTGKDIRFRFDNPDELYGMGPSGEGFLHRPFMQKQYERTLDKFIAQYNLK